MAILKITDYQIAQDKSSGLIGIKVRNTDGSISDWIGGAWVRIPFAQFPSIISILISGNAFYDDSKGVFLLRGSSNPTPLKAKPFTQDFLGDPSFDLSKKPISSLKIIKDLTGSKASKTKPSKTLKTKKP